MSWVRVSCVLLLAAAARADAPATSSPCPATAREERISHTAPAAGAHPVWMVDGGGSEWGGSTARVKTLWIVARDSPGRLSVRGRRRDGAGVLRFLAHAAAESTEELGIADAHATAIVPGGASASVIENYAFHSSYIIYPSPGCWELSAVQGDRTVPIVVFQR